MKSRLALLASDIVRNPAAGRPPGSLGFVYSDSRLAFRRDGIIGRLGSLRTWRSPSGWGGRGGEGGTGKGRGEGEGEEGEGGLSFSGKIGILGVQP